MAFIPLAQLGVFRSHLSRQIEVLREYVESVAAKGCEQSRSFDCGECDTCRARTLLREER
jgi:hypothetical protein